MAESKLTDLPDWAIALLERARVARIGFVDQDGQPRVLPITFAVAEGRIWSAVDDKPKRAPGEELARVRWLRSEPRAAVTVDHYTEEWRELAWVQVLGPVDVLDADKAAVGMAALGEKYAAYREAQPPGPLLVLEPRRCLSWRASEELG